MPDPQPLPEPDRCAPDFDRRVLFVHAHPDDETLATGATMARYAAAGAQVTLVTCTLGEEGEVLVPELEHIHASRADELGSHRRGELASAMAALGVEDWRLLGGQGRWRDSGMMGTDSNTAPHCFWQADLLAAATELVRIIRDLKPQVLVTYDEQGGYGHPDHIQAHRVAMYGALLAGASTFREDLGEPWSVSKIYWSAFPRSVLRAGIEALRASGDDSDFARIDPDDLPFGVHDELITTVIDASDFADRKAEALRCYPTQVETESGLFAVWLSDPEAFGTEYYRLAYDGGASSEPGLGAGRIERETDLFSGL